MVCPDFAVALERAALVGSCPFGAHTLTRTTPYSFVKNLPDYC